jgi:hypothetical protein
MFDQAMGKNTRHVSNNALIKIFVKVSKLIFRMAE